MARVARRNRYMVDHRKPPLLRARGQQRDPAAGAHIGDDTLNIDYRFGGSAGRWQNREPTGGEIEYLRGAHWDVEKIRWPTAPLVPTPGCAA